MSEAIISPSRRGVVFKNSGIRGEMEAVHGIVSTLGRRRDLEMRYFVWKKRLGIRLRGKYRP